MSRCCGTEDSVFWVVPVPPNSTRFALAVDEAGSTSRNIRRQFDAPGAVLMAAPTLLALIFGNRGASVGSMRGRAAGGAASGADERPVIIAGPALTGSLYEPVNVAPAWTRMVSPGCAASSAACRLPPAFTVNVV